MAGTEYHVFRLEDLTRAELADSGGEEVEGWWIIDTLAAASADAAIRSVAVKHGAGTYSAAPARSWQPRTVKVEARASFESEPS